MKIKLRTKEYEVRSLTFAQVEKFATDDTFARCALKGVGLLGAPEVRAASMAVLAAGIEGATAEQLSAEIDLENFERVMAAVMGTSRIEPKGSKEGEA